MFKGVIRLKIHLLEERWGVKRNVFWYRCASEVQSPEFYIQCRHRQCLSEETNKTEKYLTENINKTWQKQNQANHSCVDTENIADTHRASQTVVCGRQTQSKKRWSWEGLGRWFSRESAWHTNLWTHTARWLWWPQAIPVHGRQRQKSPTQARPGKDQAKRQAPVRGETYLNTYGREWSKGYQHTQKEELFMSLIK